MPTPLCIIHTRRALSPCPIFISFHYNHNQLTKRTTHANLSSRWRGTRHALGQKRARPRLGGGGRRSQHFVGARFHGGGQGFSRIFAPKNPRRIRAGSHRTQNRQGLHCVCRSYRCQRYARTRFATPRFNHQRDGARRTRQHH